MRIIKLNATHSTNDYLRKLTLSQTCEDFTCVVANEQTNGKGQLGSKWVSESGANLTFSVYKAHLSIPAEEQFLVSMVSALSVYKTLNSLNLKIVNIKWPNDILAENKKLCGILIENSLRQRHITSSIVGIGLNVNQLNFHELPKASSLKVLTGQTFFLDELMLSIIQNLKNYFKILETSGSKTICSAYNELLFRKEKPSMFEIEGSQYVGIIKRVSLEGKLFIEFEDQVIKSFNLKEVKLNY
jgi:BirA family biotin operon repressor/biotin-[acetyl-CoA-carboxylase] ligase